MVNHPNRGVRLSHADRIAVAQAGYTAQCAKEPNATHLINSWRAKSDRMDPLPETVAGCLRYGANVLLSHLRAVRGKSYRPASRPT